MMNGRRLLALGLALCCATALLHAQLVTGRLVTSVNTWERFDSVGVSKTLLRAFQTVQLSIGQGDVSLNTMAQGAVNATDEFGDHGRIRVYNLYLRWANIGKLADVNLGRQAIYAGAGIGTIDGALARIRLAQNKVTVTGFAGATVGPDFLAMRKNWKDNYHIGGQILTTIIPDARLGVSYARRMEERDPYWTIRAQDTTFAPSQYYIAPDAEAEELISGDAYYSFREIFSAYGRYDHDLLNKRTSRAQGWARLSLTPALAVTAEYIHRLPRVSFNSIFSAFTQNAVNEFEAGVEYGVTPVWRTFAKFAFVSYSDEQSHRWSAGVNGTYASIAYSGGDGYAGELQSVSAQGSYPLLANRLIPTLGVSFASYKLSSADETQSAVSILAGVIVRPVRSISVDLQGQWLTNRILSRDLRLQARLMYWFSERLSIFREEGK